MRVIITNVLIVLSIGLGYGGDSNSNEWSNVTQLRTGHRVDVIKRDLKSVRGEFRDAGDDSMVVFVKGSDVTIPRADVMRVSSREKPKRLRNALIGIGIGAGIGLAIGAAADSNFSEEGEHVAKMLFSAIGIGAGAGLGAAVPSFPTIYRVAKK